MSKGEILKKAKTQQAVAERLLPLFTAKDFVATPCPTRTQIIDRYVERVGRARTQIVFDQSRLDKKAETVATMRNPGWEGTLREVVEAQDTLRSAKGIYDRVIRNARNVRGWAQRSCRRSGR